MQSRTSSSAPITRTTSLSMLPQFFERGLRCGIVHFSDAGHVVGRYAPWALAGSHNPAASQSENGLAQVNLENMTTGSRAAPFILCFPLRIQPKLTGSSPRTWAGSRCDLYALLSKMKTTFSLLHWSFILPDCAGELKWDRRRLMLHPARGANKRSVSKYRTRKNRFHVKSVHRLCAAGCANRKGSGWARRKGRDYSHVLIFAIAPELRFKPCTSGDDEARIRNGP